MSVKTEENIPLAGLLTVNSRYFWIGSKNDSNRAGSPVSATLARISRNGASPSPYTCDPSAPFAVERLIPMIFSLESLLIKVLEN